MERQVVRVWYDPESDYVEVFFDDKPGFFRETENDRVMEKVDEEGRILGFSVLKFSAVKDRPIEVALR